MAYPEPQNLSDMKLIFKYANSVSDGIFGIGILISLYIVVFAYLKIRGNETANCFVVSGFFTAITSIFLFLMEIISSRDFFICVLACAIPVVWSLISKD